MYFLRELRIEEKGVSEGKSVMPQFKVLVGGMKRLWRELRARWRGKLCSVAETKELDLLKTGFNSWVNENEDQARELQGMEVKTTENLSRVGEELKIKFCICIHPCKHYLRY